MYLEFSSGTLTDFAFKLFGNILEAQWAEPVSLTFHSALRKLNTEPSIHVDASYQVSVHMAKLSFKGEIFLEIDQSETRIACGGHVWYWIITKCALFREDIQYSYDFVVFCCVGP